MNNGVAATTRQRRVCPSPNSARLIQISQNDIYVSDMNELELHT